MNIRFDGGTSPPPIRSAHHSLLGERAGTPPRNITESIESVAYELDSAILHHSVFQRVGKLRQFGTKPRNNKGDVMPRAFPAIASASSFSTPLRRTLLAAVAAIAVAALAPTSSRADAVGAAFGAGTGLVVAGPPGAIVGGVIGAVWGHPFWGPPNSPHACWIDNSFYRHCRYFGGRWHHY